jgi:hypothetical protein
MFESANKANRCLDGPGLVGQGIGQDGHMNCSVRTLIPKIDKADLARSINSTIYRRGNGVILIWPSPPMFTRVQA